MTKERTQSMVALQSRPAHSLIGQIKLVKGKSYMATEQEARDDERRGVGRRAPVSKPAPELKAEKTGKGTT